jgi:hypothetical protein
VAYDIQGFNFNPVNKEFSFNPVNSVVRQGVQDSAYIPKCGVSSAAKEAYHKYAAEYANQFGMTIRYQPIKYNFNTHNFIYGEDHSGFNYERRMKAVINFQEYSAFLTKYGFQSSEKMTIYIPIRHFEEIWGKTDVGTYPLAGDIFIIEDSACDRPLRQDPLIWQVNEKFDLMNSTTDFLAGHYVWKLDCTRFNYSYEKGVVPEKYLDNTPSDTEQFGRLEGGENPAELSPKSDAVDEFTKQNFDSTVTSHTSVYGKYL